MGSIQEEKKKRKRNEKEEEKLEKVEKKSMKKEDIKKESKIIQTVIDRKEIVEDSIKAKEEEKSEGKEKKISLTEDERLILMTLNFVDRHKGGLSITGFQIKDFLQLIFLGKDVDKLYFQLKEKEFIVRRRDSEDFSVSFEGRQVAEKQDDLLKHIFIEIGRKLEDFLSESGILKRVLYFAQENKWSFRQYLPRIILSLDELEQVLTIFFLDDLFLDIPAVSKVIRKLRKEQQSKIQEVLANYCKDLDFLKTLAILKMDEIKDKLGVETVSIVHYKPFKDILSEVVEKSKIEEILEKLLLLGITESYNFFGIDTLSILMSEENISKLKNWMAFDEDAFKRQLETNWNIFINAKNAVENAVLFDFKGLIKSKAVLFYKNNVLVRKEVKGAFVEVYEKVKEKLKNKIKEIENVLISPFYEVNRDELKQFRGKIIIVLHAVDWWTKKYYFPVIREEELVNNVILLISPKEIGFRLDKALNYSNSQRVLEIPDKNVEFNAVGEIDNIELVKSILNVCEWVLEEEYYSVKRAKEIIYEKQYPPISIEQAINQLKEGMREIDGKVLIDALLISINKPTNYSGTFIYRDNGQFTKNHLWYHLENILKLKYNLKGDHFIKIKESLEELIEGKARMDLFTLGLGSRPGSDIYYSKEKKLLSIIFNNYNVKSIILSSIERLDQISIEIVWIYLKLFIKIEVNIDVNRFKTIYEIIFNKKIENDNDIINAINKTGISIAVKRGTHFSHYRFPYILDNELDIELLSFLEKRIQITQPNYDTFIKLYKKKIIELVGLDYLLNNDGYCRRNNLREFLWKVSLEAWDKFDSYEGLISSKESEIIALNPLLLDELRVFLSVRKRKIIESQERLKEVVLSSKIIDSLIELDEDLVILKGFITLQNKEDITVIIVPWYLPMYEKYLGEKALIVITDQPDYKTFIDTIKAINKEITLIFLKDNLFYLFSTFRNVNFINSLLSKLEEHGFALISKEILSLETSEESRVKEELITLQAEKEETGEIFEVKELDLFGELFDTDLKGFPIGLGTEDPVVLILSKTEDDNYSATLQILCREIYRELIKGLPLPKRITEERIEEETDVSDRIIFVDDDKAKKLGFGKISRNENINWVNLGKKLQEFYSQYFGFYIFEIPMDKKEEFKEKLITHTKDLRPRIIQVKPLYLGRRIILDITEEGIKEISDLVKFKKKICSLIWGFVTPKGDDRWERGDNFDNFFSSCESEYNKRLRNMEIEKINVEGKEMSVPILVNRGVNESDLHFRIKVFIVKYLYETKKYSRGSVKTEQKIDGKEIYPDIQAGKIIFEVETLYNSERPLSKLVEKVKDYKNDGKKLIIVLKNVDVFLYYTQLIDLEEELRDEGMDVEFKSLNLGDNIIFHIKEIGKSYHSFFKK